MNLPVLAAGALSPGAVDAALARAGGFLLADALAPTLIEDVLAAAHALFALPPEAKQAIAIERSPHFRGWSKMHNPRDWREQIHLGRERPPRAAGPEYLRLEGPNLWPAIAGWRPVVSDYLEAVARLGDVILTSVGATLGADAARLRAGPDGYLLLKMIGYHPQVAPGPARSGVAAHVDFSWLTLTLQDSPGLEIRTPDGAWHTVAPAPGALWVHPGELLAFASAGRYPATPHRVTNRSLERTRVSIPIFVSPPLDATVRAPGSAVAPVIEDEHVHRVLAPGGSGAPFVYGEAEWRRKGLGGWCWACAPAP